MPLISVIWVNKIVPVCDIAPVFTHGYISWTKLAGGTANWGLVFVYLWFCSFVASFIGSFVTLSTCIQRCGFTGDCWELPGQSSTCFQWGWNKKITDHKCQETGVNFFPIKRKDIRKYGVTTGKAFGNRNRGIQPLKTLNILSRQGKVSTCKSTYDNETVKKCDSPCHPTNHLMMISLMNDVNRGVSEV